MAQARSSDDPSGGDFRLDHISPAIWTDPVAELGVRMRGDIRLDTLPVIVVVSDLLAVRTHREQPGQLLHLIQGIFQLTHPRLGG